jgi:hypothetical protein
MKIVIDCDICSSLNVDAIHMLKKLWTVPSFIKNYLRNDLIIVNTNNIVNTYNDLEYYV